MLNDPDRTFVDEPRGLEFRWQPNSPQSAYASHKCQSEIGPGLFGGLWLPYTNLRPWRVYAKSEVPDQTGTGSASTK